MPDCPECGAPATTTAQNSVTGEGYSTCQNGHNWPGEADTDDGG